MQERFCRAYINNPNKPKYKIALEAGYGPNVAAKFASKNLRDPRCIARIEELKKRGAESVSFTFADHLHKLAEIRDLALEAKAFGPAITAETSRGRAAGFYIERKEILHGRIDQMSRDEVMGEIAKLVNDFPALKAIIDTTPDKPLLELTSDSSDNRIQDVEVIDRSNEGPSVLDTDRKLGNPRRTRPIRNNGG